MPTNAERELRRRLQALVDLAYDRELRLHLAELEGSFQEWRGDQITAEELSQRVHDYHDGPAQAVYKTYRTLDRNQLIARAIAFGLLKEAEVPEPIRIELAISIHFFKEQSGIHE